MGQVLNCSGESWTVGNPNDQCCNPNDSAVKFYLGMLPSLSSPPSLSSLPLPPFITTANDASSSVCCIY
jgi:hypothetical protein